MVDKIITMIESAPDKKSALDMLEAYYIFSEITAEEYNVARELVNDEFIWNRKI